MAGKENGQDTTIGFPNETLHKETYLHCSCHTLSHTLRVSHWADDLETLYIETIASPASIFRRVWLAFKWVLGYEVVFGETILRREDAIKLQNHLANFLNRESLISDKTRPIYEWCLKYDPRFKNKPDALLRYLLEEGAETIYVKSLKGMDPDIDSEVADQLVRESKAALENYVGGLEDGDDETIF